MSTKRNFYEVLGVSKSATIEDIKNAYKKLARLKHPDRNKDPNAKNEFAEISEAYYALSDPERKQKYDEQEMMERSGFGGFQSGGFQGGFGFDFNNFGFKGDIFDEIFKDGGRKVRQRVEGENIQKKIRLTLVEAFYGKDMDLDIEKNELCDGCGGSGFKDGPKQKCYNCKGHGYISINAIITMIRQTCPECEGTKYTTKVPCTSCSGHGLKRVARKVKVSIPCGIESGQAVRIPGAGSAGLNAPSGDLIIVAEIISDKVYKRERADLYKVQRASLSDMVLGGKMLVQGLVGDPFEIEIPAGSQANSRIRISNQGMRYFNSQSRGSLYLDLTPDIPNVSKLPNSVVNAWKSIQEYEKKKEE